MRVTNSWSTLWSTPTDLKYAPYGSGKTTTALALAWSVALGKSFLDRSDAGEPGKVLFIATDSGLGPLKKACDDLGIDSADPVLKPGDPEQRINVWGHEPGQGQASWCADVNGVIRLRSFIEEEGIAAVFIDSVKSITSAAGWSHEHNLPSRELLRYLREIVCQPLGCSIVLLNHDGTKEGTHSGAKSWCEDPSIVESFAKALDAEGRQIGIKATFKKDRAAVIDPCRTPTFTLDREKGKLVLAGDVEAVGNCREAVIDVLWAGLSARRGIHQPQGIAGRGFPAPSQTNLDSRQHARCDGGQASARKTSPWALRPRPGADSTLKG